jgi:hypothetical protein
VFRVYGEIASVVKRVLPALLVQDPAGESASDDTIPHKPLVDWARAASHH